MDKCDKLHWECGNRVHGLWLGTTRVAWVGAVLEPMLLGDKYYWQVELPPYPEGRAATVKEAKKTVMDLVRCCTTQAVNKQ